MIRLDSDIAEVGEDFINLLKREAEDSPKGRSRICIGPEDSVVQEMVIVLKQGSYVRPHRHPEGKSESYHVMKGTLDVKIYKPDGQLHRTVTLDKKTPYYRLKGGWFHEPVALSDWVIYHETYQGPFVKDADVEYASWASEEV